MKKLGLVLLWVSFIFVLTWGCSARVNVKTTVPPPPQNSGQNSGAKDFEFSYDDQNNPILIVKKGGEVRTINLWELGK